MKLFTHFFKMRNKNVAAFIWKYKLLTESDVLMRNVDIGQITKKASIHPAEASNALCCDFVSFDVLQYLNM